MLSIDRSNSRDDAGTAVSMTEGAKVEKSHFRSKIRDLNSLRRTRTSAVTEDKLPRRLDDDQIARGARRKDLEEAIQEDTERRKRTARWIVGVVVFCIVVAAIVDLACHDNVRNWLNGALNWIEDNPRTGVIVFALIFCAATLLFIPGLILTIGAGVAFGRAFGFGLGLLWGTVAVLAGALAACVIAFYLGRYVLHEQAQQCAKRYRILGAVNTAIESNGVKVMFLLRLSPLVPFSGFNLIAGVTKATLRDYLIGCLGVIPGTVAFVFIGASTSGTMEEEEAMRNGADRTECIIRMTLLIVGAVAAVLALVAVTVYARRALKEALLANEQDARTEAEDARSDVESGTDEEIKESPGASTPRVSRDDVQVQPEP